MVGRADHGVRTRDRALRLCAAHRAVAGQPAVAAPGRCLPRQHDPPGPVPLMAAVATRPEDSGPTPEPTPEPARLVLTARHLGLLLAAAVLFSYAVTIVVPYG